MQKSHEKETKKDIECITKEEEKDKKESDEVKEIINADESMRDIIAIFNQFIWVKTLIIDSKMQREIGEIIDEKNADCSKLHSKLR